MNHVNYDINVGNELAQVINCHTLDRIEQFCKDHNLHCDKASVGEGSFQFVLATYNDKNIDIAIQIKRLHND